MKKVFLVINIFIFLLLTFFYQLAQAVNVGSVVKILGGKKIYVVAPASGLEIEKIQKLKDIKGLNIILPNECFDQSSSFHAGSEQTRFECLKKAIYDDSTDVIWSVRGGWGASKLIEDLKKLPKPKKEKIFIGYSDITTLHLFLSQEWGWRPVHGTVMIEFLKDDKEVSSMEKLAGLIANPAKVQTIKRLTAINELAKNVSEVKGSLTGGNLTMVQTSLGTDWQIQSDEKIIFFEDTTMKPYQVDRSLEHLRQAGVFKKAKAIIFGAFDKDEEDMIKAIKDYAQKINIPVFKTNRFGHNKFNDPLIYNVPSSISISGESGYYDLTMKK